jgi:hypothetical protein
LAGCNKTTRLIETLYGGNKQIAFLGALQCEEMQGYLFSASIPAEQATQLLKSDKRLQASSLSHPEVLTKPLMPSSMPSYNIA